jgi:hypothetical protein
MRWVVFVVLLNLQQVAGASSSAALPCHFQEDTPQIFRLKSPQFER